MITVKKLIEELQKMPQDHIVMIPTDPEGNGYHLAYGPSVRYFRKDERYQTDSCYTAEDLDEAEIDIKEMEPRVLL